MHTADEQPIKRSGFFAAALGLVPGLGLVYAGQPLGAGLTLGVWALVHAATSAIVVERAPERLLSTQRAVFVATLLLSAVASAWATRQPARRRGFQHPWWLFGYALVCMWGIKSFGRIVAERVGGAIAVTNDALEPGFVAGDLFVLVPRHEGETFAAGTLVAVPARDANAAPDLLRVAASSADVISVDNGHLTRNGSTPPESACQASDKRGGTLACAKTATSAGDVAVGLGDCHVPITTVADKHVWVMSDARTRTTCALYARAVRDDAILGRVVLAQLRRP